MHGPSSWQCCWNVSRVIIIHHITWKAAILPWSRPIETSFMFSPTIYTPKIIEFFSFVTIDLIELEVFACTIITVFVNWKRIADGLAYNFYCHSLVHCQNGYAKLVLNNFCTSLSTYTILISTLAFVNKIVHAEDAACAYSSLNIDNSN
jgi:hypothetical protein